MSYHKLRVVTDQEPEPEDTSLKVGESRLVGTVNVTREKQDLYVAECQFCGWRKKYPTTSPNGVNWDTFCHNRSRRTSGCPTNPTKEQ